MMEGHFLVALFLCTAINGEPFFFFPETMLPPIGTTYKFTFDGLVGTWKISGVYAIEAVTDDQSKTVIGYRNWQMYTGDFNQTFYGVSYANSWYPQALINPETKECENEFSETVNCTGWTKSKTIQWDNRCSIVRINSTVTGEMALTIYASSSDSTRPVYFSATTSISGIPVNMTVTYNFRSQTEEKIFPSVKCSF